MTNSRTALCAERAAPAAPGVDVVLLGPVGLRVGGSRGVDGGVLSPSSRTLRAMLAVLALASGREVPADVLFARVWGERTVGKPRNTLAVAMHRLRGWLAANAGDAVTVEHTSGGYRLVLHRGEIDVDRFRGLVAEAGRLGERPEVLCRALTLWRGDALADVPTELAGGEAVAQLVRERSDVLVRLADALVTAGDPAGAAELLSAEAQRRPLDENLHRALVTALDAAGDRAGAIATYQRLRDRLAGELGIDPGPDLRRAYLDVLRREVGAVRPEAVPADGGSTRLPGEVPGFAGRANAMRRLDEAFAGTRAAGVPMIQGIVGMAGVGKTSLAVSWARGLRERFPDGLLYVDLRGYSAAPPLPTLTALGQLLRALGMPGAEVPADEDEAAAEFRSRTAGSRLLVLLDNARDAAQVRPLLAAGPGCATLLTSRDRLTDLVARDGGRVLDLDVLSPGEAATLLVSLLGERARAEPSAVAALAVLCAHLPLALRIAAANLRLRPDDSLSTMVSAMRAGDRLAAFAVEGDPQAAVRAAFDISYHALDEPHRLMFRLLGLVRGPDISSAAAAALAGCREHQARRCLGALAAAHLVQERLPDRFSLHDLLAVYARALGDVDRAPARRRLAGWYAAAVGAAVDLVDPHVPRLPAPAGVEGAAFGSRVDALAWLDAERASVLAVVEDVAEHGPGELAWTLADGILPYLRFRGRMLDAFATASVALDAARRAGAEPRVLAAFRLHLADACEQLSRYAEAVDHCAATEEQASRAGWPYGLAASLTVLSVVHGQLGRTAEGLACANRSLEVSREHRLRTLSGRQLNNLGIGFLWYGLLDQAEEAFIEALGIHRATGALPHEILSTNSLAQLCLEAGRLDEALGYSAAASEAVRREGELHEWPRVLNTLAAIHSESGHHAEALEACGTALPVVRRQADRVVECSLLYNIGVACAGLGQAERAREAYEQALQLSRRARLPRHEAGALLGLAGWHCGAGNLAQAEEYGIEAVKAAKASRRVWRHGQALTELARVRLAIGRLDDAEADAREALALHRGGGHRGCASRVEAVLDDIRRTRG